MIGEEARVVFHFSSELAGDDGIRMQRELE